MLSLRGVATFGLDRHSRRSNLLETGDCFVTSCLAMTVYEFALAHFACYTCAMQSWWGRWAACAARYARWLVFGSVALAICGGWCLRGLAIYSDFKRMLPDNFPSVRELSRIETRVQSTSTLQVVIGGEDWPAMRRFIDDFVARVPTELGDLITSVEYNTTEASDFFRVRKYLYVEPDDLREIHARLKRQIDYEKLKASQLLIDVADPPQFDVKDIEEKYRHSVNKYNHYREGYYTNDDATLAVVLLQPKGGGTNVDFARTLLSRVDRVLQGMRPTEYHPSLRYTFAGRYPGLITEFDKIIAEMRWSLILCVLLVGLVVHLFFRQLRMGFCMICAAGLGTLAALVAARFVIGYLTAQTAFLGSIILGNGINFSIILLARYLEERRERQRAPVDAMHTALAHTWLPTLATACTNSVAFAALGVTHIRSLAQFGFIGVIGMLSCWIITYGLLPGWLLWSESWRPLEQSRRALAPRGGFHRMMIVCARTVVTHPRVLVRSGLAISIIAIGIGLWYAPRSLEYNFNNLRFKPSTPTDAWAAFAQTQTGAIFGQSATPAVLVTDSFEDAGAVCDEVTSRATSVRTENGGRLFDQCRSLAGYVPKHQTQKLQILADIRALLSDSAMHYLTPAQRADADAILATKTLRSIALPDLPQSLRVPFHEADGSEGKVVYVYADTTANMWDGRELRKFSDLIREIHLPQNRVVYGSGEYMIFSDLLQTIVTEGPRATLFSFGCVCLLVLFVFRRRILHRLVVIGSLCTGVLWMLACLPIFGVKLNFLNFVAFPITFGIGVDYAINMYQRFLEERTKTGDVHAEVARTITQVGGAVALCSLTTIIGYGTLMISSNRGLVSLGLTALLGEWTCITVALFLLPAWLVFRGRKRRARKKSNTVWQKRSWMDDSVYIEDAPPLE